MDAFINHIQLSSVMKLLLKFVATDGDIFCDNVSQVRFHVCMFFCFVPSNDLCFALHTFV